MNCDRAQAVLSDRLDGERSTARIDASVDEHRSTCARCQAFETDARRLRASVRVRVAEPVPDLVSSIMAKVSSEVPTRSRQLRTPRPIRPSTPSAHRLRPLIAAGVAGLIVGSLLVGGPWQRSTDTPLAAAAVATSIQATASTVDAFAASYAITEYGLAPDVRERQLRMDVSFLAPQRFRLDVLDETRYPSTRWTPTDLTLISDGTSTYRSGPTGCPASLPAGGCPPTRSTVTTRSSFSVRTPAPADLILPLVTFSSASGIQVLGTGRIAGRSAVHVRLSFARARALFPFLELGGTWRPFFDGDRVDLWLDEDGWFPLRYTVYPSVDPSRAAWELRFGLPAESPDEPIFDVRLLSVAQRAPEPSRFVVPGWSGIHSVPLASFPRRVGYLPVTPTSPGDLHLTSAFIPPGDDPDAPRSMLLYTDGLAYVRIGERPDWMETSLFGPMDTSAQEVGLNGGGIAYYEPEGEGLGRRLAIHTTRTNVFLESNVPRAQLLTLAASLPLKGEALPRDWRTVSGSGIAVEQVSPAEAMARSPVAIDPPSNLLGGYVLVSAQVASDVIHGATDVVTVSFVYRQPQTDAAGGPLVLHLQRGAALPPASSSDQTLLTLGDAHARWTLGRDQLEWIVDGAYLSLEGAPDLAMALDLAAQILPNEGATP